MIIKLDQDKYNLIVEQKNQKTSFPKIVFNFGSITETNRECRIQSFLGFSDPDFDIIYSHNLTKDNLDRLLLIAKGFWLAKNQEILELKNNES